MNSRVEYVILVHSIYRHISFLFIIINDLKSFSRFLNHQTFKMIYTSFLRVFLLFQIDFTFSISVDHHENRMRNQNRGNFFLFDSLPLLGNQTVCVHHLSITIWCDFVSHFANKVRASHRLLFLLLHMHTHTHAYKKVFRIQFTPYLIVTISE